MNLKKFHIGVKALIVSNGKVLALKDSNRYEGFDLPGGRIDPGEGIEKALKRELNEEIGLKKFKRAELLHVAERVQYNKDGVSLMLIFYKVNANISKIKLSKEHTSFEWISKKDFIKLEKNNQFRDNGIKTAIAKVLKLD